MTTDVKESGQEIPWRRTMGYPKDYLTTGNGRVDDDFRIPGYFIEEAEARELWKMKNCWRTSEERNRQQGLENNRLRKRLAAFEEAAQLLDGQEGFAKLRSALEMKSTEGTEG